MMTGTKGHFRRNNDLIGCLYFQLVKTRPYRTETINDHRLEIGFPLGIPVLLSNDLCSKRKVHSIQQFPELYFTIVLLGYICYNTALLLFKSLVAAVLQQGYNDLLQLLLTGLNGNLYVLHMAAKIKGCTMCTAL